MIGKLLFFAVNGTAVYSNVQHIKANRRNAGQLARPEPKMYTNAPLNLSQRVYGIPAASLISSGLDGAAIEAGSKGEIAVGAELERWAATEPNTYVFHSLQLPDEYGDIDHMVVRGQFAILIDSKMWQMGKSYNINQRSNNGDVILRDGEQFAGGEIHMISQLDRFYSFFSNMTTGGILTIAHDKAELSTNFDVGYAFVTIDKLGATLDSMFELAGAISIPWGENIRAFTDLVIAPVSNYPVLTPSVVIPKLSSKPIAAFLMGVSIANVVLTPLLWMFTPFFAVGNIVGAHIYRRWAKKNNRKGRGFCLVTLITSYTVLSIWLTVAGVIMLFNSFNG